MVPRCPAKQAAAATIPRRDREASRTGSTATIRAGFDNSMAKEEGITVRVTQIDGKYPNLALMRIAAWHRKHGDKVVYTRQIDRDMFEPHYDKVYGSAIFKSSQIDLMRFERQWPGCIVGGTGSPFAHTVEDILPGDVSDVDYTDQDIDFSMGFSQRGCRLSCEFCVVPQKEGKARPESSVHEIWRGDPHPKHLYLLDNDFFGNPMWRNVVSDLNSGGFKVCLSQGINARKMSDAMVEAAASLDYRAPDFKTRRIYTAWDNSDDEAQFMRGLDRLKSAGIAADNIMVYVLVGYWDGETINHCLDRIGKLRSAGVRPYPMPFKRTKELVGLQRWVVGAYDKRFSWGDWERAGYRPERLQCNG